MIGVNCGSGHIKKGVTLFSTDGGPVLATADTVEDLRIPPSNRLEKLAGSRKGQYSIRVNDRWRICFRWHGGDAQDVEIVDYH